VRLFYVGLAILGHAVISQLLYAGIWVQVDVPAAERRAAGDLMYYGGDIAELLLALAVVTTWHPRVAAPRRVLEPGAVAAEQVLVGDTSA